MEPSNLDEAGNTRRQRGANFRHTRHPRGDAVRTVLTVRWLLGERAKATRKAQTGRQTNGLRIQMVGGGSASEGR